MEQIKTQGIGSLTNAAREQLNRLGIQIPGLPTGTTDGTRTTGTQQDVNWMGPMALGAAAGEYQRQYLKDQPPFPGDETGIKFQTAKQAMADPELRFKPQEQYVLPSALAAEGGRIGYQDAGDVGDTTTSSSWTYNTLDNPELTAEANAAGKQAADAWLAEASKSGNLPDDIQGEWDKIYNQTRRDIIGASMNQITGNAQGGRIGYFNGGIQGLMPQRGRVM